MVYVFTNLPECHCRLNIELLNVCKIALQCLTVTLHVLQFMRDIDATMSKFLSKNKGNYLQHHFVHNYSMSSINNGMRGNITAK